MRRSSIRRIELHVVLVSLAGVAVLIVVAPSGTRAIAHEPFTFWVLGLLAVVGELFPVRLPRREDVEEITTSTTFGFALMLAMGTGAAALALAAAALAADVKRKPSWKALFNMSVYVLSIGAAGSVYAWLGGSADLDAGDVGPMILGGVAFFLVNTVLVEVAVALSQALPPLHHLRDHFAFQAATAGMLLCLAPVVLVLAERSLILLPLLALPVAAVYWGARESVENEQLVELNRLKDDLIAVVSHELRTPLTSIQGYVKTVLQLGDQLDPEHAREFLEGAVRQSDRLRRLIEELLVVARLDARVESIDVSWVSLPLLAGRVVQELAEPAGEHGLRLVFDPDLPAVRTDEAKVHRILFNLAENALKYAPAGTDVEIHGRATGTALAISVHDHGPGISPEDRERIFERFHQVDQTTTRRVGGVGLGLYICKKLAEAIGGELTLERSGADGSVFSFTIPLEPPRERARAKVDEPRETEATVVPPPEPVAALSGSAPGD
jgi:signal transduction histidine kinase